jgi:hypothetical protein
MSHCLRSVALVALAAFIVSGTSSRLQAQRVGGKSKYTKYAGTATITKVEKTKESDQNKGKAKEGYEVWFTFKPAKKVKEALGRQYLANHHEHQLTLMNGWHPGPEFLKKYGIEKDKEFKATLSVIVSGTTTPVILELDGVDRADYFEASPRPQR